VAQVNVQAEKLIKDKFVHADVVEYTVQYRGRTNKKYPPYNLLYGRASTHQRFKLIL